MLCGSAKEIHPLMGALLKSVPCLDCEVVGLAAVRSLELALLEGGFSLPRVSKNGMHVHCGHGVSEQGC